MYAGLLSGFLVLVIYDFPDEIDFARSVAKVKNINIFLFTLISICSMIYIQRVSAKLGELT